MKLMVVKTEGKKGFLKVFRKLPMYTFDHGVHGLLIVIRNTWS